MLLKGNCSHTSQNQQGWAPTKNDPQLWKNHPLIHVHGVKTQATTMFNSQIVSNCGRGGKLVKGQTFSHTAVFHQRSILSSANQRNWGDPATSHRKFWSSKASAWVIPHTTSKISIWQHQTSTKTESENTIRNSITNLMQILCSKSCNYPIVSGWNL